MKLKQQDDELRVSIHRALGDIVDQWDDGPPTRIDAHPTDGYACLNVKRQPQSVPSSIATITRRGVGEIWFDQKKAVLTPGNSAPNSGQLLSPADESERKEKEQLYQEAYEKLQRSQPPQIVNPPLSLVPDPKPVIHSQPTPQPLQ